MNKREIKKLMLKAFKKGQEKYLCGDYPARL